MERVTHFYGAAVGTGYHRDMKYVVWVRQHSTLQALMMVVGLCGLTAQAACGDSEGGETGDGTETPQPDAAADDASQAPDTSPDASDSDASTPEPDASADDPETVPPAAAGTCSFIVDGSPYETAVGDISTQALFYAASGDITVACGVQVGGVIRSVNLSVSGTKGPGSYNASVLQYSEQPESSSSIKQWRKFSVDVAVSSASDSNVAGASTASLPGADGTTKEFSFSFNLTPTVK